jgi:hypothetical protein
MVRTCKPGDSCNSNTIVIFIVMVVCCLVFVIMTRRSRKKYKNYKNHKHKRQRRQQQSLKESRVQSEFAIDNSVIKVYPQSTNQYLYKKENDRMVNPLLPPERSYEQTYGVPINIPTRGESGGFQQVGMLYKESIESEEIEPGNNNSSQILGLYGKPIRPGSSKWSYYTSSDGHNSIKMPLSHKGKQCGQDYGCDELYDGDNLSIPSYNGNFKVNIYKYDKPRYIPYV